MTDDRYQIVLAALKDCANLNCARAPLGKHWKKDLYCGECTSCRARAALEQVGEDKYTGRLKRDGDRNRLQPG